MITLAAFDMAGTTIDDGGGVYLALQRAVEETGAQVEPEHLQAWMGAEKREAIRALMSLGGEDPDAPGQRVDHAFERFRQILHEQYLAQPPTAMPGAAEAIESLREQGIRVALTTGFSRDVAETILDRLGWQVGGTGTAGRREAAAVTVDALVCGDEVATGRPAPYMIHRAMELTGTLSTSDVLVAGDTVVDVQAGANSGAAITIGVLSGKLDAADFAGEPYTALLESVAEVPRYLRG